MRTESQGTTICRSCGTDITPEARYNHWTQCSVCYWKGRLERLQSLENLLPNRSKTQLRLKSLTTEVENLKATTNQHCVALHDRAPWWRKVLGNWQDETLGAYRRKLSSLEAELRQVQGEHARLEAEVELVKKAKKRYIAAQTAANASASLKKLQIEQRCKFGSSSINNLDSEFKREAFCIQRYDYRRGNAIDNYFRSIAQAVFAAFHDSCAFCGGAHDLTFDHYGTPKNEGGNFALILWDKSGIQVNIVVLCRSCNASKGQVSHLVYFSEAQRKRISACHGVLLESLLKDQKFLRIVKKWSQEKGHREALDHKHMSP